MTTRAKLSYFRFSHHQVERQAGTDDDVDCGDKTCTATDQLLSTCIIYVDESSTKKCTYPCSLDNCVPETHHFIICTVWTCFDKTTTVPASTLTPAHKTDAICSSSFCIASVTVNVLIILVLSLIVATIFLKKKYALRTQTSNSHTVENALFNSDFDSSAPPTPIIRSAERFPLLSNPRTLSSLRSAAGTQARTTYDLCPTAPADDFNASAPAIMAESSF